MIETPPGYVAKLLRTVGFASDALRTIPESSPSLAPRARGWSACEILGHLVDSASVNHERFVRARFQDDLVFAPYDQDVWVSTQNYANAPWHDFVTLWSSFNLHIARVMAATPAPVRERKVGPHNFHRIAWKTVAAEDMASLDYLMRDYVEHLKHHLCHLERLVAIPLKPESA